MGSTYAIPKVQRAYVLPSLDSPLKLLADHPVPAPDALLPGQCLVRLTHSGVCHSDIAIKDNWYNATPKPDLVGGHEGVGVVVAIGAHTRDVGIKVGDRVGIKYMIDSCMNCDQCRTGWECFCPSMKKGGFNFDGTFAEYTLSYVDHVTPIPDALDSADAASIMCAGFTVYSALKQSGTKAGDWVVILGAGGGLGHLAVQYAVVMGLRTVAIDTGADKRQLTLELGAEKWIDFKESANVAADVIAATGSGAHAALVLSGGGSVVEQAVRYLRPRGYIVIVGLPRDGVLSLSFLAIALRGLTIRGVFIGGRQAAIEAVSIAASGKVKSRYTLRGLSELERVYEDLEEGKVVGRIVLDISK
ncbi:hypothetical protein M0805_005493 [Coniferiporia weirii]|nr:hypothetical protein M0805_005493 [Coniferiporia weirii]